MTMITLSFDNGPDAEVTPRVLDTLAHHGIKATFFVVGNKLEAARAAAERAHAEGHWIGNHTWSHSQPFRERGDAAFVRAEIDTTQQAMGALAHQAKYFRPYGGQGRLDGALNRASTAHLSAGGFTCVLWNAVPGDWKDHDGWPATAMAQIAAQARPLVVLHDIHGAAMVHLDRFIGTLKDQGHSFQQAFPDSCIAIDRGVPTAVLSTGVVEN
ncbi:MAG TPA: polysaccharide deacetylase family protein [Devosia sp.]|nr:polysaccharide deacetylase family protein [Devosia sp.]